ncbi:MAG: hypothetical protein JRH11_18655 [Deltaproteobacteria bacterium]|nr:hypothetical protein [Deltaproteobacteria bacterium]
MSDIGTITELEPEDGLGWIEVGNGDRIRFGGTACKGFVPAIGMTVEVHGTKPGFRGTVKATEVTEVKGAGAKTGMKVVGGAPGAAAPAPRTNLHKLQSAGLRADDLLLALLGRADVDDTLHQDLEALHFEVQPQLPAGLACDNPWLYVVAMDGGGNAYGLYTHPLLAEHLPLPWVFWDHEDQSVKCLAADTATFLQGMLATARPAGVDPAVIQRAHGTLVKVGMPDAQGQAFGDGEEVNWLPPGDDALRPLDQYLAETDGGEMERGLLAYASRRRDAQAKEALYALYETWQWTVPG